MKQRIVAFVERLKRTPNKGIRILVGALLVIGGILGALPILGFWMIPLGLAVLAVDFPWARRAMVHLKLGFRALKRKWRRFRSK